MSNPNKKLRVTILGKTVNGPVIAHKTIWTGFLDDWMEIGGEAICALNDYDSVDIQLTNLHTIKQRGKNS